MDTVQGNGSDETKRSGQTGSESAQREQHYLHGYGYGSGYGAYPAPYSSAKTAQPLHVYLQVVFRYRLLVLCITAITVATSLFITSRMPRMYSAISTVNIGSYMPPAEGPMARFLRDETTSETYITNQLELLKSYMIAKKALTDNADIREYLQGPSASKEPKYTKDGDEIIDLGDINVLSRYLGSIKSAQLRNTTMVRISATSNDPEMAAKIANAHARAFTELVRAKRVTAATVNLKFLEREFAETKNKVEEGERNLKEFVRTKGKHLSVSGGDQSSTNWRMLTVIENLSQAVLSRAAAEAELRELKFASGERSYSLNSDMRDGYVQLLDLKGDYKNLSKVIRNKEHPWLADIKKKIGLKKKALELSLRQQVKDAEVKHKANLEREKILRDQLEGLKTQEHERSKGRIQYEILKAELQSAKTLHRDVARRLGDLRINASNKQKTVTVIDSAVTPQYPSSPNKRFNLMLACVAGPLLGILLAFILDFFNNKVQTATQLESLTNLPMLGIIPSFANGLKKYGYGYGVSSGDEGNEEEEVVLPSTEAHRDSDGKTAEEEGDAAKLTAVRPESDTEIFIDESLAKKNGNMNGRSLVLLTSPLSAHSEAFRHVRTIVTCASSAESPKIILVTSGQKEDGKTTVATNLAVSIAQTSEKTLLIDGDLRLPSVQKFFQMSRNTPGLSNCLAGEKDYNDVTVKSRVENLDLLLAGGPTKWPAELIASKKMKEILSELYDKYDRIVIDSPPISRVADALLLSRLVEGVIVVVRSGKTPLPLAESAVGRLKQMDAPVLGTVLNDVRRSNTYKEAEYYYINSYP